MFQYRLVAANRQAPSVDELAEQAEQWLLGLSNRQALRKAGGLSKELLAENLL
jgi:hypothetical protein